MRSLSLIANAEAGYWRFAAVRLPVSLHRPGSGRALVHTPTAKVEEINGELARYKKRNGSKTEYTFVNSETAPVWPSSAKK
jgi:hypothetical protein